MEPAALEETDVRAIVRILGHVAAMPDSPDAQRAYLMAELARFLDTDTWVWAVAPLLDPGKQPVYIFHQTGGFDELRMSRYLTAVEHPDCGKMTAPLALAFSEAGSQITRAVDQIVSSERYASSPSKPFWEAAGIDPIMITLRPVPGYGISCIAFYRPIGAPQFTGRDSQIAHIILGEVPLLHEAGMPHATSRTLPQLPPRCRLIINQLVHGLSRKTIAEHLGLRASTVNGYVKKIFDHFQVHSQAQLIARFTRGDGRDR